MNSKISIEKKSFVNKIIFFIAVILVFFVVKVRWIDGDGQRWRTIVETDGKGYYAYLPAIFLYHDLKYDFIVPAEASIYGIGAAQERLLVNGQPGNKYFVGSAVLMTPFFLLAWLISVLTGHGSGGYNMIFFTSVAVAALFYLLLGLFYLKKLFRLYEVNEKWIGIILLLLVFATNVLHYAVYEPSMSHVYSFAAVSVFLYYVKVFQIQKQSYQLVCASIALAIISLIRPVNIMAILCVPFLTGSFVEFKILIRNIFEKKKTLLLSIICFSVLAFIQPFIYYLTTGNFFSTPYSGERFYFMHPHFWDGLFSYRKGLFVYTPIIFFALLFIIPYFKKSMFAAVSFILSFLIIIWVITSWYAWTYGGAFGLRPVIEYYPYLIIPMAVGLNNLKRICLVLIIAFVFIPLTGLCLLQTYQYDNHILSYDEMNKEKYWKVFLKTDHRLRLVAYPPDVDKISHGHLISKKIIFYDFENDSSIAKDKTEFFSGSQSLKLNKQFQYSPGCEIEYSELLKDSISYVEVNLMAKKYDDENDATLVVSFGTASGQIDDYFSYPAGLFLNKNEWEKIGYSVRLIPMAPTDKVKIYVWNNSDFPLFVDDMRIEFFEVNK